MSTTQLRQQTQLEVLFSEIDLVIKKQRSQNVPHQQTQVYKKAFARSHVYFPVKNNLLEKDLVVKELKQLDKDIRSAQK